MQTPPVSRQRPDPLDPAWAIWAAAYLASQAEPFDRPAQEASWYVAVVLSGSEWRAAKEFHEDGIETYVPVQVTWKPRNSRRGDHRHVRHSAPLLPGYVFARMPPALIGEAMESEIVFGALSEAGIPKRLPEAIISDLQARERRGEFDETRKTKRTKNKKGIMPDWAAIGAVVRAIRGPFSGLFGKIESIEANTLLVGLELFGRATPVHMEPGQVRPA